MLKPFAGWWSLIEIPKKRILPSERRSSTSASSASRSVHSSFQTCSCSRSTESLSRLLRLRSAHART
jgi:hypothetical protein